MIDTHTHVLPGIDDGSRDLVESVSMLRMEAAQGIGHVIATPHFYAQYDRPEEFLRRRQEAEEKLRREMAHYGALPKLSVGAEVYYFRGMSHAEAIDQLAIRGTPYILVEMPMPPWTQEMYRELEALSARCGLTPIIAHVDRYIRPIRTYGIPKTLETLPVLVQANASFFLNRGTRSMALKMLRRGQIQLLGSDCHDPIHRKPCLGQAVEVIIGALGAEGLEVVRETQKAVFG